MTKNIFPKLATEAASSVLDRFERKRSWQGQERSGRRLNLFISNVDLNGIIKIIQSLDGASETVKREIKK